MATERINGLIVDDFTSSDHVRIPTIDQIMQLIDGVDGLTPEERENIRLSLIEQQARAEEIVRKHMTTNENHSGSDYLLFVAMLTLIALVFAYFSYLVFIKNKNSKRRRATKPELIKNRKKMK